MGMSDQLSMYLYELGIRVRDNAGHEYLRQRIASSIQELNTFIRTIEYNIMKEPEPVVAANPTPQP